MDRSLCSSRCVVIHTKLAYLERTLLYFYRKLLYSIYLSASQHTSNCFFHYSVVDITSTLSSEAFHIILHIIFLYIYYYYWFVMGGCRGYKSLVNRCWVGWLTFQSSSVPYLLLSSMFISLLSKWSVYLRNSTGYSYTGRSTCTQ